MRQLDFVKELQNEYAPANNFNSMKNELKFYNERNKAIETQLSRNATSLSTSVSHESSVKAKFSSLTPLPAARFTREELA
jgi:hypothetical protein